MNENIAEMKIILFGEACWAEWFQQCGPLVHREIIRFLGKSSAIHQLSVLSNALPGGSNRGTNWRVPERQQEQS
ncbi:MAG: hypothetical protein JOY77_00530 [Alphaproteobacteria bacterium]|nr:hypothetical protein [Alphaproteobacteria bacterium]MBV9061400.1 hypothetical protein [Alphaproteobacteria bacterium]